MWLPRLCVCKNALILCVCVKRHTLINYSPPPQPYRQVINNTQMWCSSGQVDDAQLKTDVNGARKDIHLSPFEVIRKVFAPDPQSNSPASLNNRLDLFFQDYSLIPLFVQENYVNVRPFQNG